MPRIPAHRVVLLVPPVGDCTMPMLGVHTLAGYLNARGVACRVYDASIETLRLCATPDVLKQTSARQNGNDRQWLASVVESGLAAMSRCEDQMLSLTAGLRLFSLLHSGFRLSADDIALPFQVSTSDDLAVAVTVIEPIMRLFERTRSFAGATEAGVGIVGISVSFPSQLVAAIGMAQAVKRRRPETTLVLGGSCFGWMSLQPADVVSVSGCIDLITVGAGEKVLEALANGVDIRHIPGSMPVGNGAVVYGGVGSASVPDFSDVPWDLYLSGARAAPFSFHTVCHYGRCRFCSGDRGSPVGPASERAHPLGVDELLQVTCRYAPDCLYIVDAAVPPKRLRAIAHALGDRVRWAANARPNAELAEPGLLRTLWDGGCWMLRLGLESGSQRVLDAMAKGTRIHVVSRVLEAVAAVGVRVHVYVMLGYPGEGEDDREQTISFLHDHRMLIHSYSVSIFQANPGTTIYRELCGLLGVDEDDHTDAVRRINAHLYPDEGAYSSLRRGVDRIASVLRGSSKTNRFCYSGRVFTNDDASEARARSVGLLRVETERSALSQWAGRFASVVQIIPRTRNGEQRVVAAVDLVNDEVITYEAAMGLGEDIPRSILEYSADRDARRLAASLPASHTIVRSGWEAGTDSAIQHTPVVGRGTDGNAH